MALLIGLLCAGAGLAAFSVAYHRWLADRRSVYTRIRQQTALEEAARNDPSLRRRRLVAAALAYTSLVAAALTLILGLVVVLTRG